MSSPWLAEALLPSCKVLYPVDALLQLEAWPPTSLQLEAPKDSLASLQLETWKRQQLFGRLPLL